MSNNRLKLDGLEELRAELRKLPADMRDDAETIVFASANDAAGDIRQGYASHRLSGELVDKVEVEQLSGGSAFAGSVLQSKSKLAFIFENGTQARHTGLGYNRGVMPPGRVFIPAVIKRRREMYDKLRAMMRSHGLTVVG